MEDLRSLGNEDPLENDDFEKKDRQENEDRNPSWKQEVQNRSEFCSFLAPGGIPMA